MTDEPKKTRTPKQNALEFRFTGIVRVPLLTFDEPGFISANTSADVVERSLRAALPFGCEINVTNRGPGKMDVPPAEPVGAPGVAEGVGGETATVPLRKDIDLASSLPEAQRRK